MYVQSFKHKEIQMRYFALLFLLLPNLAWTDPRFNYDATCYAWTMCRDGSVIQCELSPGARPCSWDVYPREYVVCTGYDNTGNLFPTDHQWRRIFLECHDNRPLAI